MADYAKISVSGVYSENSDYSNPRLRTAFDAYESTTATQYMAYLQGIGFGSAEVLDMSAFTTIESVMIHNKDTTNYVTVTFLSAGNSAVPNILRLAAGKHLVLSDVTPHATAFTVQANTAACDLEVVVFGT
jgi:hypothetical protein